MTKLNQNVKSIEPFDHFQFANMLLSCECVPNVSPLMSQQRESNSKNEKKEFKIKTWI